MPFKTEEHANLGYVDKHYKSLLEQLQRLHKRTMKDELEYMIERLAKEESIKIVVDK